MSFSRSLYEIESEEVCVQTQSIVLIGARRSSTGEYFFLFYFIEVSGEDIHCCDAKTSTEKLRKSAHIFEEYTQLRRNAS